MKLFTLATPVDTPQAGDSAAGPSWHPLNETQVVAFNESEQWEELCDPFGDPGPPISPPNPTGGDVVCFPLETQNVALGVAPLELTYSFGWMYLNLNVGDDTVNDDYDPGTDGTLAASWVITNHSALGAYSVGLPAVQLTSACQDLDVSIDL